MSLQIRTIGRSSIACFLQGSIQKKKTPEIAANDKETRKISSPQAPFFGSGATSFQQ